MPYPKGITYGITFVLSILCINARALLADFTVSSSIGCAPFYLSCTNLSSGASSYDWDWGDGSSHASITTPSHTYSSPGTYTITLTAYSSSGASSVKTKSVIVSDTPFVFFKASDTVACTCNSVSFTDSSVLHAAGSGTYLWQFGDGGTSASKNPAYAYCSSRSTGYSVILKVTNSSGCISSLSKPYYIHVYDPPSASFSASPTIICGTTGTVNFTSSVSGGPSPYTYDWDFGDGTSHATSANPAHTYSSSSYGSFTVTLVVTSRAGCKDTIKMTNYINLEHFVASFTTNPSPPSICANEYLIVTNTSTPGFDATTWVWGDGDSSNVSATYHLYDTARTYTVKLISSHGDCKDSTTKSVTVRPLPVINFGASPLQPCPAPVTINFTDSSSGVSTYSWNFGDGGTSTAKNPSHTYYKNKSFDVTLKGTNSYGCTDSLTRSGYIKIYDLLSKINDGVDSVGGCAPFNQPFYFSLYYIDTAAGLAVNYPYSAATAKWNFGDGDTSGSFNPTHSYKFMGNYKVTLTVTTSNGCTVKDSVGVRSGSHSHPSFTGSPNVGCVHQTIFFDNTTPDGRSYYWFFGDGGVTYTYDTGIVQHKYSDTGHFEVALVSVNNGCQDTFIRKNYLNIILPRANYDWIYVCDSINKMIFRSSSEGVTSFIWRFGDGTIDSTTDSPAHTYPISPHLYPDTLVVYNSTTGCHDTSIQGVQLFKPSITIKASDTVVCLKQPVTYVATINDISVNTNIPMFSPFPDTIPYLWYFDNNWDPYDSGRIVSHTLTKAGYHNIMVVVYDYRNNGKKYPPFYGYCMDTAIRTNYIGVAEPVVNFSANPDNGCLSLTTTFIDSTTDLNVATITSRRWDFGDGSPNSTAASPTHVYSLTGDFSVKLVAVDNVGCTDSFTRAAYVHVHKPGAAFFASPVNACPGTPVNFINTSSGIPVTSYWDFGDGTTSTDNSPLHYYANTGTYTVKLYILDTLGCRDTITKTSYIRITAKPHAKFGIDDTFSICTPLVVNFSDSSTGAVSYLWDFGDPLAAPSIIRSPGWTYKYPGIYHIYEVVTNAAGCTDTAWGTVYILGYRGAFSYTPLVGCSPLTVDFRVLVHGVPDFIYDFDDGNTKKTTDTTYVHTYTQIGAHVPKLIMTDDNGCSSESIGLDTILVDGVYEGFVAEPQPLCDSGTVELFDTSHGAFSAIVSHKWIFHDGTTANVRIPKHTYHGPGTYSVILIDSTNTSCVDTLNSSITFWPLPDIDAGPDTTICLNDHAVLNPTGGVVYVWSPGASLSCDTCIHPDATPAVATVYKVIGTDIHGCKNSDTVEVFIKTKTTSIARGSGEICDGEYIQLNDSAGYNSVYDWVPDYKLSDPHASDPIASPDTTTLYIAVAKQAGCIADSQYVNVIVHPRPDVSLGPDQIMIAGNTVQLNAVGSNLDTLAWRPAGSLTCDDCMSPIADPKQTTTYYVIVHTIYNCYDSADVTIKVICDKSQVYMPNTFTPNGDGQNDVFYPHGKGLRIIKSFKIYDRWGQIIFEHDNFNTNQKENGWDGTFKGAPLSPDVFVYLLDAICDTGEPMQWKGDVSLIR